ncbi:hypothetical protein GOBAR_DD30466 [Gossypium barbadense]|nr:hypothetical protein GOBAR_DD30466 [Gossypium barbadense]
MAIACNQMVISSFKAQKASIHHVTDMCTLSSLIIVIHLTPLRFTQEISPNVCLIKARCLIEGKGLAMPCTPSSCKLQMTGEVRHDSKGIH